MIKKTSIYIFFTIVTMVLLSWYTYQSMLSLGFEASSGLSYAAITKLTIVVMALFVMIVSANGKQTNFSILWLFWTIWLVIDFYVLGLKGKGVANIFNVTFCPMIFILFYTMNLYCEKPERIGIIGFIIVFIIAFYLNISILSRIIGVTIGEDTGVTNLVFWCLCSLPMLLIFKNRWTQIVVLGITFIIVLLTGKRSATISMLLIFVVYYIALTHGRRKLGNTFLFFGFIIALYFIVTRFFEGSYWGVIERMNSIEEDQGSGRIQIYADIIGEMKNNSFFDWIFGRGCSSITVTRHSNAHNDALQMLFEYGILGLMVYVIMLIHVIKRTIILRKAQSTYYLAYAASVIITIVLGLVSNLIVFYSYFAFICAFWGIVEARLVADNKVKTIHFA